MTSRTRHAGDIRRRIDIVSLSLYCPLSLGLRWPLTVLPLPRGRVDDAEELVVGHGLGVEVRDEGLHLHVLVRLEERLPHHGLAGAREADDKHRVPHLQQLHQLHHLKREKTKG